MHKRLKAITDFDYGYLVKTMLVYAYLSFIYSLMVSAGVGILFDRPLWPLGLAAFFSIFHLGDFPHLSAWGKVGRVAWLIIMASGVSGAVWMLATSRPVQAEWWGRVAALIVLGITGSGILLGSIEGIRPRTIEPYLRRFANWWLEPAAPSSFGSEPVLTRWQKQKQAQQINDDDHHRINLDEEKATLNPSDIANQRQDRQK